MENQNNKYNNNGFSSRPNPPRPSAPPRPSGANPSAEDRLNRSMRNLSYTSGGVGSNTSFDISKYTKRNQGQTEPTRKKVGGIVLDDETIKDVTNQKMETRGRRNNVIILILCLLLVVSVTYLVITILQYNKGKRQPNCFYHIKGDASAEWIIEDSSSTKLIVPEDLKNNTKYLVASSIKINSTEAVLLTITVSVTCEGEEIEFFGLTGINDKLVQASTDSKTYMYDEEIVGGGTIYLFGGIDFQGAPAKITGKNIQINITADLTKVVQ